ncbi:acyltransferase family protein [Citrobacter sp. Cf116]|uniref:acyltransferase family protein n=1 Tax=Citrobacter sp. Cf116 TaxID=2985067 RepID=UPI0025785C17|nr:acyltransferase family protein [Citrobacter sp. Cf116]MDM3348563.1 acyltransferase [Citrobacter sp. Cf116]
MNTQKQFIEQEKSLAMDYAKAFGIFFVLIGHIANEVFNFYNAYLFHMPLFFLIGGMLYKGNRTLINLSVHVIKKQTPFIVITYLIIGYISIIITSNYGIRIGDAFSINIYETIKLAIKSNFHNNKLFLTCWFLFAYIFVSIFSSAAIQLFEKVIKNKTLSNIALVVFCIACIVISINHLALEYATTRNYKTNLMCQILTGMAFYTLGYTLKNVFYRMLNFYAFILLTTLLFIFKNYGLSTQTIMSWSYYPDGVLMTVINALIGAYAIFYISSLLAKCSDEMKLLRNIGQKSRTIMAYHLLVYVVLDIIAAKLGIYSLVGTDAYNNHYISNWSLPIYIAAGLFIPLLLSQAKDTLFGALKPKFLSPLRNIQN